VTREKWPALQNVNRKFQTTHRPRFGVHCNAGVFTLRPFGATGDILIIQKENIRNSGNPHVTINRLFA
jgi:hypothetical protein